MGVLQPGLPSPALLPKDRHLLIVDSKDCLFTIKLHPKDFPISKFKFTQAREAYTTYHQNAKGLARQFGIAMNDAKGIVKSCPTCSHHGPGLG
ncbi:POK7 protein, partial [Eubucco bourcierii]|nr:POK7 protein [Eubucco bourcierii]